MQLVRVYINDFPLRPSFLSLAFSVVFSVLEFNRDRRKRPRIREQQTYECGIELRLDEVGQNNETKVTCDAVLSGIGMRNDHRRRQ